MTEDREQQAKATKAEARRARLAEALRANLRKRKARQRGKDSEGPGESGDATRSD